MRLGVSGSLVFPMGVGSKYAAWIGKAAWDIKKHPRRGTMYKKAAICDLPVLQWGARENDPVEELYIATQKLETARRVHEAASKRFMDCKGARWELLPKTIAENDSRTFVVEG